MEAGDRKLIFDGMAHCRVHRIGQRNRRTIRTVKREEIDAFWQALNRGKHPLRLIGGQNLNIGNLTIAQIGQLHIAHDVQSLGIVRF